MNIKYKTILNYSIIIYFKNLNNKIYYNELNYIRYRFQKSIMTLVYISIF